jgi:hypothetical protein
LKQARPHLYRTGPYLRSSAQNTKMSGLTLQRRVLSWRSKDDMDPRLGVIFDAVVFLTARQSRAEELSE